MAECIFCKIANKEIPKSFISEDSDFLVFEDINPKAPVHLLIIPKAHFGPVDTLNNADEGILGRMVLKARAVADQIGVSKDGYRLIFNVGKNAGMEIDHIHLHLLAGKPLKFEF